MSIFGLVPQAQVVALSFVLTIVGIAIMPGVAYESPAGRIAALAWSILHASVAVMAVQCAVVGQCNVLAWIFSGLLAISSIFSLVVAIGLKHLVKTNVIKPDDKNQ